MIGGRPLWRGLSARTRTKQPCPVRPFSPARTPSCATSRTARSSSRSILVDRDNEDAEAVPLDKSALVQLFPRDGSKKAYAFIDLVLE